MTYRITNRKHEALPSNIIFSNMAASVAADEYLYCLKTIQAIGFHCSQKAMLLHQNKFQLLN